MEQRKGIFSRKFDEESNDHQESQERIKFIQIYRITSWRENIYIIFGTWSVFAAMWIPSERHLPLRGLEWSFMNFAAGSGSKLEMTARGTGSSGKKNEDTDNLL